MDEELETLVVKVRADTRGFARDVEMMRALAEGPLAEGMERAGRTMEGALRRFVRTGKFGFEDLKRTALAVMADIANAQLRAAFGGSGIGGGPGGGSGGGLGGSIAGLLSALFGLPGRAGGGPVAPGSAYVVGERGPELFVPTASGRIEPGPLSARAPVTINVNVRGGGEGDSAMIRRSGRQIARAVQRGLAEAGA